MGTFWQSPDGNIRKEVLFKGSFGLKPSEGSKCIVTVKDCPDLSDLVNVEVTIGDNDGELLRTLDICLTTMFPGEKSKFTLNLTDRNDVGLVVELASFVSDGFVYQWNAAKKYSLALHHKEKGVDLFRAGRNKDAGFRFTKAAKFLELIQYDCTKVPTEIDGVKIKDINKLKENLFNNLSSCYFKNGLWSMVIELSRKVLELNGNNVKALYKLGVAYEGENDFEKAEEILSKLLKLEPENAACLKHLSNARTEMKKSEIKLNAMVKKMFGSS